MFHAMIHKYSRKDEFVDTAQATKFVRGSRKIKTKYPYSSKNRVLRSPYYRCVYLWNQLDYKLQHICSNKLFGKRLRTLDLSVMKLHTGDG